MEKLTDVELEGVALHEAKPRSLGRDASLAGSLQEDDIETAFGPLHVIVQGDRSKKAMLTYHDIGLNSTTCFQGFFNFADMQPILRHFCVYHVNAPGQHEGALPLPQGGMKNSESANLLNQSSDNPGLAGSTVRRASLGFTGDKKVITNYQYPDMDQLSEMLLPVLQFYNIKTIIGFGVGAGANVLSRFALSHPERMDGLCLINATSTKAGWGEWGFQKWNSWYLKSGNLTSSVEEYLLWHWFGQKTMQRNHDLVMVYSDSIRAINPQNLAHYIESYIKRSDLGIIREIGQTKKTGAKNLKCPVMLVAGEFSPHLNDTVNMNGRLDPANSTWMKFECGGMVHEEAPNKLCDAFRLFLQGMGFAPTASKINLAQSRSSIASNTNLLHNKGDSAAHTPAGYTPVMAEQEAVC